MNNFKRFLPHVYVIIGFVVLVRPVNDVVVAHPDNLLVKVDEVMKDTTVLVKLVIDVILEFVVLVLITGLC